MGAGHRVSIAGYGRSLVLLQKEFPELESIEIKGFSPSYPRSGNMVMHMLLLLPKFLRSIFQEHKNLKKQAALNHYDIILSDNRYGFWVKNIKSILITHQVMIKTPAWLKWVEYPLYLVSRIAISRFDECWIPDIKESPGLSGDLSHKYPLPAKAKFIGPLSRFNPGKTRKGQSGSEKEITVIISGPEPQRSIFEKLVLKQLTALNQPATIVSGKPESGSDAVSAGKLKMVPHLPAEELQSLIENSSLVICRPGYSSVMDLSALGSKALFVPTPGQTEQVYLARLHHEAGTAMWCNQEALNLITAIPEALHYAGFKSNTFLSEITDTIAGLEKK